MLPRKLFLIPLFLIPLMPAAGGRQNDKKRVMTGSAARAKDPATVEVVPDLDKRVAQFREVQMLFRTTALTVSERKMIDKLVEACRYLEGIYWRQMDPDALTLYQSLADSTNPRDVLLRRYLWINASRFDLIDGNKPFAGKDPMSPGRGFYPQGLTRAQIEKYVAEHPERKAALYSPTTVVRWHSGQLEGLPYHIAYRSFLEPAATALRDAAKLSTDS